MRKTALFSLLGLLFLNAGIQKTFAVGSVKAKFYLLDSCQYTELTIHDTSTVTGTGNKVISWQWYIGGASISTSASQNPTAVIFFNSGTSGNTIKLVVEDSFGNKDSFTRNLNVLPNLKTDFNFTSHCSDTAITFTDNSGTVQSGQTASYKWDFGDGGTSTSQNPSAHKYSAPGIYFVSLTTTLSPNGCGNTVKKGVTVYDKPGVGFTLNTATKTSACQDSMIDFTDTTNLNRLVVYSTLDTVVMWDFGDGTKRVLGPSTQNQSGSVTKHAFKSPGNYTVKLIAWTVNGCIDSTTKTITIYPKAKSSYTVSNNCQNALASFTNTTTLGSGTITSRKWNFGDPSSGTNNTATTTNATHTYTASGKYSVTLITSTDHGCVDTAKTVVDVPVSPTIKIQNSLSCEGQAVSFSDNSQQNGNTITGWAWDFGDGKTGKDSVTSHTYSGAGSFTVKLTLTNSKGCSVSGTKSISVFNAPKSNFTNKGYCIGKSIGYSDASTIASGDSIKSWYWDFGDPNSTTNKSSKQYDSHTYNDTSGIYTVTLVTTSKNGCTDSFVKNINIQKGPKGSFTNSTGCQNTNLNFTYTGTTVGSNMTYKWDFGDTSITTDTSSAKNPIYNFAYGGFFNIRLITNSSIGCPDTLFKKIIASPKPEADFIFDSVCFGSTTHFTDNSVVPGGLASITAWDWDFGDGSTHATTPKPTHNYAKDGTFKVTLTVTTNNGCKSSITKSVIVYESPKADFTYVKACREAGIKFTDKTTYNSGSITKFIWGFNDGTTDSLNQNPTHIFPKGKDSSYLIFYEVTGNGGCKNQVTRTVFYYNSPKPEFSYDAASGYCRNLPVDFTNESDTSNYPFVSSYTWDFGDTIFSTAYQPQHTYKHPDTFYVSLIAKAAGTGCVDTVIHPLVINGFPISKFSYKGGCIGKDVKFIGESIPPDINTGLTFEWDFGDGSPHALAQNASHQYTTIGKQMVTLVTTTSLGCTDTLLAPVFINPVPATDFIANTICQGKTTFFKDTTTIASTDTLASWFWEFGDGSSSTDQSTYHIYDDPGTFDVRLAVTSKNNCTSSIVKTITVHPNPVADFSANPNPVSNDSPFVAFTDLSSGHNSYTWDFGDSITNSFNPAPVHEYILRGTDTATFYVTLKVANQYGCTDSKTDTIVIKQFLKIFFPNVITANGDRLNDTWKPVAKGVYKYHCQIISRWGQVMYESDSFGLPGWNGDYKGNGVRVPEGVYTYYIYLTDYDNLEVKKYFGNITVLK